MAFGRGHSSAAWGVGCEQTAETRKRTPLLAPFLWPLYQPEAMRHVESGNRLGKVALLNHRAHYIAQTLIPDRPGATAPRYHLAHIDEATWDIERSPRP